MLWVADFAQVNFVQVIPIALCVLEAKFVAHVQSANQTTAVSVGRSYVRYFSQAVRDEVYKQTQALIIKLWLLKLRAIASDHE